MFITWSGSQSVCVLVNQLVTQKVSYLGLLSLQNKTGGI